ncbi:MAG: hypothetical protein ACKOA8_14470, partial [Deltaproteobacteria bacterium]
MAFFSKTYEGKPTSEFSTDTAIRGRQQAARVTYTAIFALFISSLLYFSLDFSLPMVYSSLGDIANEDIISPLTTDIEPLERDSQQKETLAQRVPPIFDYDENTIPQWLSKWKFAFKTIRKEFYNDPKKNLKNPAILEQISKRVIQYTGQTLRPRDLLYLHENRFNTQVEETFFKLTEFLKARLISDIDVFFSYYATGITLRKYHEGLTESLITDVSRIWSLDQAREVLSRYPSIIKDKKLYNARVTVEILDYLIPANLSFNQSETEQRINQYLKASKQPVIHIKKGQVLIHRGEKLTESHLQMIQSLKDLISPPAMIKRVGLAAVISFLFLFILFSLHLGYKKFWELSFKDSWVFQFITLLVIAAIKYGSEWLQFIFSSYSLDQLTDYLLPLSVGAIMLHLMIGRTASYTFSIIISVVSAFILNHGISYPLFAFVLSASAIHAVGDCRSRADLFKCGALSGFLAA